MTIPNPLKSCYSNQHTNSNLCNAEPRSRQEKRMRPVWIMVTSFIFRLPFSFPSVQILLTSACYFTAFSPRAWAGIQTGDQALMKISVPADEIEQLPASTQRCWGQRGLQWPSRCNRNISEKKFEHGTVQFVEQDSVQFLVNCTGLSVLEHGFYSEHQIFFLNHLVALLCLCQHLKFSLSQRGPCQ